MTANTVLTTGRLDGLVISPVADETGVRFLAFTVDTLPGMRLMLEVEAAAELRDALAMILGGFDPAPASERTKASGER